MLSTTKRLPVRYERRSAQRSSPIRRSCAVSPGGLRETGSGIKTGRYAVAEIVVEPPIALAPDTDVGRGVPAEREADAVNEVRKDGLILAVVLARRSRRCDAVPLHRARLP